MAFLEFSLKKIVRHSLVSLILSISLSASAVAAPKYAPKETPLNLGGFSLSPTVGGISYASTESRGYSLMYGVKIGYDKFGTSIIDNIGVEGTLNYFSVDPKKAAGNSKGYLLRVDVVYPFKLTQKIVPFLALGPGGIFSSGNGYDGFALVNYGAGVKYFFEDYFALRTDIRHILVYDHHIVDTRNNIEVSFGLSYYFGKERKKQPAKPLDAKEKEQEKKDKELKEKEQEQKEKELKEKAQKEKEQKELDQEEKERKEYQRKKEERLLQEQKNKEKLKKELEEFELKKK